MAKKSETDSASHFFGGSTADDASNDEFAFSIEPTEEDAALEGEIAVDVYQTDTHVVIVSPVAGVDPANLDISATDDSITISGERASSHTENKDGLVLQEIYWGSFSRTVTMPVQCVTDKATATFKHGILTIKIPKVGKTKKRTIKVKSTE